MRKPDKDSEFIFATILLLANRLQTNLDKGLEDLTLKQWLLLCMRNQFEQEEVTVNELAAFVGYSRQNIKKIIDVLVGKEYLTLEPSTTDRRAYNVKLTEKTYNFFKEFKDIGDDILDKLFEGIDSQDQKATSRTLMQLLDNIEQFR